MSRVQLQHKLVVYRRGRGWLDHGLRLQASLAGLRGLDGGRAVRQRQVVDVHPRVHHVGEVRRARQPDTPSSAPSSWRPGRPGPPRGDTPDLTSRRTARRASSRWRLARSGARASRAAGWRTAPPYPARPSSGCRNETCGRCPSASRRVRAEAAFKIFERFGGGGFRDGCPLGGRPEPAAGSPSESRRIARQARPERAQERSYVLGKRAARTWRCQRSQKASKTVAATLSVVIRRSQPASRSRSGRCRTALEQ